MSQQNPTASNTGRAVVHVRQDSDHAMEDMFRVLTQPPGAYVPLRERHLPESFFKPPNRSGNHSRESSADSTSYLQPSTAGGLTIPHHSKSFSSPASLQETLSVAPPAGTAPVHPRQQSFDMTSISGGVLSLPTGWEMATTPKGERYFLNHQTQTTTWVDPRKSPSSTPINLPTTLSQTQNSPQHLQQQQKQQQQSPNINSVLSGPLPPGWEQAFNPDGETYFINHLDRTTSWFDPRLPAANRLQQHSGNTKMSQLQSQLSQNQQLRHAGLLNKQQEAKLQQQFQLLQREKEMLARKQQEIQEQELRLLSNMGDDAPVTGKPSPQTSDIQSVSTSGVDPFLSQTGTAGDHNRQNSADSGLGGMGTSYSLPRTPEDFLSNVDEMDSTDLGQKLQSPHSDFTLDSVQGTSMDMGSLADPDASNNAMDSDDLMPSLQEEISSDLLNDVETVLNMNQRENFLTWL